MRVQFFVDRPEARAALARAAEALPRHRAGADAPQPRPRRPARPRGACATRSARPRRCASMLAAARALSRCPSGLRAARQRARRARRPGRAPQARARRRTAASSPATAASSPPAMPPSSTSGADCATRAGARSPPCRRATPARPAIGALKIRHNNVIGYYIEVSANANAGKLGARLHPPPDDGRGACATPRSSWPISKARSPAPPSARWRSNCGSSTISSPRSWRAVAEIAAAAAALAALDLAAALAELRRRRAAGPAPRSRPAPPSRSAGGRHPTVEAALARQAAASSPTTACWAEDRIWLVTGPNMAGKSTFLRQNALIAILAQIGSYVPARAARIGIVDRLFSRVGAADDLARGRSTFMVEMVETAAILNQARPRSVCHPRRDRPRHRDLRRPLDRLGRARASARGQPLPRPLRDALPRADRARREAAGARLPHDAGQGMEGRRRLPARGRARHRRPLLRHPCRQARRPADSASPRAPRRCWRCSKRASEGGALARLADDLPLFSAARRRTEPAPRESPPRTLLRETRPDELTPREALDLIYRLKALAAE